MAGKPVGAQGPPEEMPGEREVERQVEGQHDVEDVAGVEEGIDGVRGDRLTEVEQRVEHRKLPPGERGREPAPEGVVQEEQIATLEDPAGQEARPKDSE